MTLRDDLVEQLEKENDALRARVKVLEELAGATFESPPQFSLTQKESVIFGLLMKNTIVRKQSFIEALYFHQQDEAEIKIVDVFVCKVRRKLKPWSIEISTQWGQGYFMPAESKAIAQALIDEASAA
jgi:two-component system cell cycle response regulator CtrA